MFARVSGFPGKVGLAFAATTFAIAAPTPTSGAALAPVTSAGASSQPTPVAAESDTTSAQSSAAVPLPATTLDWQKGKVFKIGDDIKDPKSGLIFQVNDVHSDSTLGGLSAGQT
jgi:hypothetical protein